MLEINNVLKRGIFKLKEFVSKPRLESEVLLSFVLKKPKIYLISNSNQLVNDHYIFEFNKLIDKRINGVPLQYLTNTQEFMGIDFYVNKDVLIPRPDTELLVEYTLNLTSKFNKSIKILDICTGSGCIAISLAKYCNCDLTIDAVDISEKALEIAKKNATINNVSNKINFFKSNLFENIHQKYDFIVSNPPYIATEDINTLQAEVQKEPIIALDGGLDGLDFYRWLINDATQFIETNGFLILEIGYSQAKECEEIVGLTQKYRDFKVIKDYGQNDRVVSMQK